MTRTKLVITAVLALLVLIVILQNTTPVETKVLFFTLTMPRAVLLIGTTLIGFLLGVLVALRMAKHKKPE